MNRVVITGMGALTPIGNDTDSFWNNLIEGRGGVRILSKIDPDTVPCKIGAEVVEFDPLKYLSRKEARRMDPFVQYSIAAAEMAMNDAGIQLDQFNLDEFGVALGTAFGALESLVDGQNSILAQPPKRLGPYFFPKTLANMGAAQIAMRYGLEGPNVTVITACASASNAIATAFDWLRYGRAKAALAGGSDAPFVPLLLTSAESLKACSNRFDDPERASRPFDADRDGMVVGEGAAVLMLETEEHALRRGAKIYAELLGYGTFADAYHVTAPAPDGRGEIRSMQSALRDAGLQPEQIDYINAHATSTPLGDKVETLAIKKVFGEHAYKLSVSSIKGATGHMLGAAGSAELVATVKAIETGIIPPTINYTEPDPDCDLDYTPNRARRADVRYALSNSFGFGGQNASIIVGRYE